MISIEWATTKRIFIPRADMPIAQASPEIRELDVGVLRLALKDLEAAEEGIVWPDTHRHSTETTISGFIYARFVEILAPYTVEFEDGQYSVRAIGANHNILDVKINNQVSLAVQNSAGLIQSPELQFASFNRSDGPGVLVDPNNTTGLAQSGTAFPSGTSRRPVDNFSDAVAIAAERGFNTIYVLGQNLTLDSGPDYQGFRFLGQSSILTSVTVASAAQVATCEFYNMTIDGTFDGAVRVGSCVVGNVQVTEGEFFQCGLAGTVTLTGGGPFTLIDCYDAISGVGTPTIDFGGVGNALIAREYQGALVLRNKSGAHEASIDLTPGRLILESTITGGAFIVKGVGKPVDNQSTGTATVDQDGLVSAGSVWARVLSGTNTAEQALDELHKLRGLDSANPLLVDKANNRLRVPENGSLISIQGVDAPGGESATFTREP